MAGEIYHITRAGRPLWRLPFLDPSKRAGRIVYRDARAVARINLRIHKLDIALKKAIEKHYLDPVHEAATKTIHYLAKEVNKLIDILLKEEYIELDRIRELGTIGHDLLSKADPNSKERIRQMFQRMLDALHKEVTQEFRDLAELSQNGTIATPNYAIKLQQESLDQEERYLGRMERRYIRRAVNQEHQSLSLARQVQLPEADKVEKQIKHLFQQETNLAKYEAREVHDTLLELIYALNHLRILQNTLQQTKQKGFPPLEIDNMLVYTGRIHDKLLRTLHEAVNNSRALLSEEYRGEAAVKRAA